MYLRDIKEANFNLSELVSGKDALNEIRDDLLRGVAFKIPHNMDKQVLREARQMLGNNFDLFDDTYTARVPKVKNYRQRHWDHPSQIVPAKYISWSFFPWNSESRQLFSHLKELFYLRNLLANLEKNKYLDEDDPHATARLAFQFYPRGEGYMHEHQDPKSTHQLALPTLLLSDYRTDYCSGGFYALDKGGHRVIFDTELEFGDLTLFHPSIPHGVEIIDPEMDLSSCNSILDGRLMMIAGVNGYAGQGSQYDANVSRNSNV